MWNNPQSACWITSSEDQPRRAIYFKKHFNVKKDISSACAYVCGIGYHKVFVNGSETDDAVMSPVHSNYKKTCYYTVTPEIMSFVNGENTIEIILGDGWRCLQSAFVRDNTPDRTVEFFGIPQLTAAFHIKYTDGSSEYISTGPDWSWSYGPIVMNDLFDGETYDASFVSPGYTPARTAPAPCERMLPQTLEPIREKEIYPAESIFSPNRCICRRLRAKYRRCSANPTAKNETRSDNYSYLS